MADQTYRVRYFTGQSLKLKLFTAAGTALSSSPVTLSETGVSGLYTGTRTAITDSGDHYGVITDSADAEVGVILWFRLLNATGTYDGDVSRLGAITDAITTSQGVITSAITAGPGVLQATTIATLSSQTSFTLTAGSADDDAYDDCTIIIQDQSTAAQKAVGHIINYPSALNVRLLEAPCFTIAVGDLVYILPGSDSPRVVVECTLTSSAGTAAHISAYLEFMGRRISIVGANATVVIRELSADVDLFTVTETDLLGATAIFDNVFRMLKATPGFTDDRTYVASATIRISGRDYTGTALIPCLGGV